MEIKVTIIVTVLNEEKTIKQLLMALEKQTYPIEEIIITDAGSLDKTRIFIQDFQADHPDLTIKVIEVAGNRSIGRNTAIDAANTNLIAVTDAGCVPHPNWLEELIGQYKPGCVVAGYYDAAPKTAFEQAVVPYVLVMPDKVNPDTFLPATRSLLLEKETWSKIGAFNEQLRWNEDYEFAKRLVKYKIPIRFAGKAKVSWVPRHNLIEFWKMIWHFAQGDVQAGIWRNKVKFIFVRYIAGISIVALLMKFNQLPAAVLFSSISLFFYSLWALSKNQKYVREGKYWLPILQFVSDLAVMGGSLAGLVN